jgi:hypothetical protein
MLRSIALALAMAATAGWAQSPGPGPDPDSALYIESVVHAKRGPLCAARIPGYADAFAPVFARWRADRASQLERGESLLREALASEKLDFDLHLSAITGPPARQLGKLSQSVLETNCQAMLRRLGGS